MTIKKQNQAAGDDAVTTATESVAVIADRFKLDSPKAAAEVKKGGKLAAVTLIVALLAMAVAGVLTFTMYQHWEFLKGA